jgi:hypothetical protein
MLDDRRLRMIVDGSTPDPDGYGPCEECAGGLAHFPECSQADPTRYGLNDEPGEITPADPDYDPLALGPRPTH